MARSRGALQGRPLKLVPWIAWFVRLAGFFPVLNGVGIQRLTRAWVRGVDTHGHGLARGHRGPGLAGGVPEQGPQPCRIALRVPERAQVVVRGDAAGSGRVAGQRRLVRQHRYQVPAGHHRDRARNCRRSGSGGQARPDQLDRDPGCSVKTKYAVVATICRTSPVNMPVSASRRDTTHSPDALS